MEDARTDVLHFIFKESLPYNGGKPNFSRRKRPVYDPAQAATSSGVPQQTK